jgi:hypothetical protein
MRKDFGSLPDPEKNLFSPASGMADQATMKILQ